MHGQQNIKKIFFTNKSLGRGGVR